MHDVMESARELDAADPPQAGGDAFWFPRRADGAEQGYLCGHSLGLQPRAAEAELQRVLRVWREHAVAGHFRGDAPDHPAWIEYGEVLSADLAHLVGAYADEVTVMNSLTVNLHLLMVSFYRPRGRRRKILIEEAAFPSDRYAVASQIRFHGLEPDDCLVEFAPTPSSRLIDEDGLEAWLQAHGEEVALVLWPGVQYASGQAFDLARVAAAARAAGAKVGFDLAHSAGNLPLRLHDSGCDFAAWCTYKYLNGGPGSVAAAFVHRRHSGDDSLPRFEGWWGNERTSRFRMEQQFVPATGADAWVLSNPPILAMAPLRASLRLFREAGMEQLRTRSVALTGWLADHIESDLDERLEILTPADAGRRGCQLSLRVRAGRTPGPEAGRRLHAHLEKHGVITDWREPDVIRVAPVPLYNRYAHCAELLLRTREWAEGDRE